MFMHDFRIRATTAMRPGYRPPRALPQARLGRQDEVVDAFFWQTMTLEAVTFSRQLDAKNLPAINQAYLVPHPSTAANSSVRDRRNAVATYSLWNTFVGVVEVRRVGWWLVAGGWWPVAVGLWSLVLPL